MSRRAPTEHASGMVTITSKLQLTIPAAVARNLQLKPGDKLFFTVDRQGRATGTPVRTLVEPLAGSMAEDRQPPRRRKAH